MTEDKMSAKLSAVEDNIANEPVAKEAAALMIVNRQAVVILALAATNLYCDSLNFLFDNFKKHLHFFHIDNRRLIT